MKTSWPLGCHVVYQCQSHSTIWWVPVTSPSDSVLWKTPEWISTWWSELYWIFLLRPSISTLHPFLVLLWASGSDWWGWHQQTRLPSHSSFWLGLPAEYPWGWQKSGATIFIYQLPPPFQITEEWLCFSTADHSSSQQFSPLQQLVS